MEIDKQFQKLSHTRASFENAIKKDLETIVNGLKIQFDIYERGTTEFVTTDKLTKEILSMFQFAQEMKICSGITKAGTRCTKRSVTGCDYCKAHIYKSYSQQTTINNPKDTTLFYMMTDDNIKDDTKNKIDGLEKILIEGSLYYTDSSYVYDTETFDKVGYVENGRTVLTDDPFELQ